MVMVAFYESVTAWIMAVDLAQLTLNVDTLGQRRNEDGIGKNVNPWRATYGRAANIRKSIRRTSFIAISLNSLA